jgi:hypothetical protein
MGEELKVWLLDVHHKHGNNVTVFHTEDGARHGLAEYARVWWSDYEDLPEAPPEDDEAVIEAYFNAATEEYYTLDEVVVL